MRRCTGKQKNRAGYKGKDVQAMEREGMFRYEKESEL